jgi:hypothetical protein
VLEQGKKKKLEERQKKGEDIVSLDYNLRPQLFLQSVNENVGDALHSLHAYHDIPRYSVYRAGKYLARLAEATEKALEDVSAVPYFVELKEIGRQAMAIKATKVMVHDQELEGDPKVVDDSKFFKSLDVSHSGIEKLHKQIVAFGARVPALFHSGRAKKPATAPAKESAAKDAPARTAPTNEKLPAGKLRAMIADFQRYIDDSDSAAKA